MKTNSNFPFNGSIQHVDENPVLGKSKDLFQKLDSNYLEEEKTLSNAHVTISEEISSLHQGITNLEKYHITWRKNLEEFETAQSWSAQIGKYFYVNFDLLNNLLKYLSACGGFDISDNFVKSANDALNKLAVPALGLGLSGAKLRMDSQTEQELESFKDRYFKLKARLSSSAENGDQSMSSVRTIDETNKIKEIEIRLDKLSQSILEENQAISHGCLKNFSKFASSAVPLGITLIISVPIKAMSLVCKELNKIVLSSIKIHEFFYLFKGKNEWQSHLQPKIVIDQTTALNKARTGEQDRLQIEALHFISDLEHCESLAQVNTLLKKHNISIKLPTLFPEWQDHIQKQTVKDELIQSYYHNVGKHPFMNTEDLQTLLEKRKDQFNEKVDRATDLFLQHFENCKDMESLEEIIQYFAGINGCLDRLEDPPKNKADWDQKAATVDFQKALATEWVKHQEALAQQAELTLRQMLKSKISQAQPFIMLDGVENAAQIGWSLTQLWLSFKNPLVSTTLSALDSTIKNLSEVLPFIGFATLFYPEWKFKCIPIIFAILRHCIGKYYKPNEYTFEGYKLALEIRWMRLILLTQSMTAWVRQMVLWINIRLIENCVLKFKDAPFEEDARVLRIKEKLTRSHENCNHQINSLKDRLNTLRSMDNMINLFPDADKSVVKEGAGPEEILAESLLKGDFEYFPESTCSFIGKQLGVELTNNNKDKIVKSLKELFLQNDDDFVESFTINRAAHIKA